MESEPTIEELFPMIFHGTSSKNFKTALASGLSVPNHWGSLDVARFFAKAQCREVGGRPVIIAKPIGGFLKTEFQVDEQMLDFPVLADIRGADHGEMADRWEESDQVWVDCLRIYESVVYNAPVAISCDDVIR